MPFYVKQGSIPTKRHITFKKDNGELYREELFSTHGFSNIYSNKYHHNMPTKALEVAPYSLSHGKDWQDSLIQNYKLDTKLADSEGNFFNARNKIFFNNDVAMYTAKVTEDTDEFYRNAYADEVVFIHEGEGTLYSEYGALAVKKWDYLIIPRGTTYQLKFSNYSTARLFVIESSTMVEVPKHFRNEYGQMLESAPYCERDIRTPELQQAIVEKGNFSLVCKFGDKYQLTSLEWHPFDLVGWDGCVYPWAFNIQEYAPKVGKIHLPPSDHIVFTAHNFVICNFVPRPYDFHPQSIPAPYYHSNIDSDEVLYYVDGDFMSRTGIEAGYMTLHQKGVPHGPQPGRTEASIGKTETYEYAVMVDTFAPLKLTEHVKNCMSIDYNRSWIES
ncbi:homogentisate 1,2-dioxygenase [Shewanella sp. Choline-02u-19]|uniref:homogentisate 1,2-dioxygenase n=1 Tax=unclassified Shewanella TaxID=196818 RepID=UPI000C329446|nr:MULTISPECIES: homogentisate 1,2-dioxygenase [unclassified Shewanella]PKG56938.1 homogentisate 1,2-dioxygenase [Shewanella sp. GutDb-MelDb]PKG72644.1 homogentisate 1,2-dioxygenase [Shewanella sp. GutCb]PKH56976.1 homogentisate 1,2-dioxygenase [Shewanella sp. Bg11-22]PKI27773.1 homogentisate 1,2-dioxygenase [Shewanella sp. Choline-02u-19]